MNLQTITVDPEIALGKLKEYRGVIKENRRKEDADFRRLYRMAGMGKPILDVLAAFKATGVNEQGLPKLALARADWKEVHYNSWAHQFTRAHFVHRGKNNIIDVPGIFDRCNKIVVCSVPFIPPAIRPKDNLEKYHILFEVKDWKEYPADPFLLRQIKGWLFVVVAEWELTDLERSLLSQ